jgi:hypothetical protein
MNEAVPSETRLEVGERSSETMHGLLVMLVQMAREILFFETLADGLGVKMKVVHYTHQQKLETIVAGLAVGCRHVSEMQTKLVPDTTAAALFGMARFPDQAHVNAFLQRCGQPQVEHLAQAHQQLLEKHSLVGDRSRWLELADGRRVLTVDLDQTPIVTRSKRATGTAKGYFGRKRGNVGYKKSVAFLGGGAREVLWLRLEPGNTHAQDAVPTVLAKVIALGKAQGVAPEEILGRGDSQYGNVGVVRQYQAAGMHYLFAGYTPSTARRLADGLPDTAVWHYRGVDSNGSRIWVADAGEQELVGEGDLPGVPPLKTRVILQVRVAFRLRKKHGRGAPNQVREKTVSYEHYVTDLSAEALPVVSDKSATVLEVYNGRETEESFFRSEQDALGAQYLRTYKMEGEASFLWLMGSTANLLRWTQHSKFAGTQLETVGLTRLVTQAMQIPATITRTVIRATRAWIITLPETARLARHLASAWMERELQLPLPFEFVPNTS